MPSPLTIRPIGPDEVDLFLSFADASALGLKPPREMYLDGLHKWYRPEWSWVALHNDTVLARVAFSGEPGAEVPFAMGSLEIGTRSDRVDIGVLLVTSAYDAFSQAASLNGGRPRYHQFLPIDWHDNANMRAAVEDRRAVARLAGLSFLVERLEHRWFPAAGLRNRPGRLTFRPIADDAELHRVVRETFTGTLDADAQWDIDRLGMDEAVASLVADFPESREFWRVAHDSAGACVGITVSGFGTWGPDIAYIGVQPQHRGNGYADDLLIEATHLVCESDTNNIDDISATTDVGNTPMAAAFARCGFTIVDRLMVHV